MSESDPGELGVGVGTIDIYFHRDLMLSWLLFPLPIEPFPTLIGPFPPLRTHQHTHLVYSHIISRPCIYV